MSNDQDLRVCSLHLATEKAIIVITERLQSFSHAVETLSNVVNDLSSAKADRMQIYTELTDLCSDIKEIKVSIQQMLISNEKDKAEHEAMRKDVTLLKDTVIDLKTQQGTIKKEIQNKEIEDAKFRTKIGTYGSVAILLASTLPHIPTIFRWIGSLLNNPAVK